jgi:hypothetical protein
VLSIATMLCQCDICFAGSVPAQASLPDVCDPTPVEDRLPEVIAAMAGCWELTATLGDEEVRIVRDLRKKT